MPEDITQSKYNAGILQTERIHNLQDMINKCSVNPIAFNQDERVFNYQIVLSCLNSLYLEAYGKLTKEEKAKGQELKEAIEKFIVENPIYSENIHKKVNLKEAHWVVLKQALFDYEKFIREMLDVHAFNSPKADESAWF